MDITTGENMCHQSYQNTRFILLSFYFKILLTFWFALRSLFEIDCLQICCFTDNASFNEKPHVEPKKSFSAKYVGSIDVPKPTGLICCCLY